MYIDIGSACDDTELSGATEGSPGARTKVVILIYRIGADRPEDQPKIALAMEIRRSAVHGECGPYMPGVDYSSHPNLAALNLEIFCGISLGSSPA